MLFFALGYAFYACAFAVAGSIVSRPEDMQNTTSPLLVLLVGGYVASLAVLDDPDSALAKALTFVPPAAPMVVPIRTARDALAAWELAVSIALLLLGTLLLIRLGERVYERTVLRLSAPVKLSQVLRRAGIRSR
jgi:ABC-2 type transport system permease protein